MSRIKPRHIEIFHAVMTSNSLTEAAEKLGTSQPTVSRELAQFEKQIKLALFQKTGGRLQPTTQGLQLFSEVQRSWYGMERIINTADNLRQFRMGELSIACLPVFSQSLLPRLFQPFIQRFPDVSFSLISQESPLLEEWLSAQRYDLGLTETHLTPAGTERIELMTCNEVCVLPGEHPLAKRDYLTPEDFEGQRYISFSPTDSYRQLLDALFIRHQVTRKMVMETYSAASVCAMVRSGAGIAIVNPLTALDYVNQGVAIRRFSVEVPFTVSLIRPLHRPFSALAEAFSEHLQQSVQHLNRELDDLLYSD